MHFIKQYYKIKTNSVKVMPLAVNQITCLSRDIDGADDEVDDDESGAFLRVLAPMRQRPSVDVKKRPRRKWEGARSDHRRARFGRQRVDATVKKGFREDRRETRVGPSDPAISYDLWLCKDKSDMYC